MHIGIIFAIITATAFGFWTIFHKLAAPHVNNLFGAILVSLTAAIIGLIFLMPNIKSTTLFANSKGIIFIVLAGVCAIILDYFALKTYETNISISIAGPIIMGGGIAVAIAFGFFLGEPITALKLIGIFLVIAGTVILSTTA